MLRRKLPPPIDANKEEVFTALVHASYACITALRDGVDCSEVKLVIMLAGRAAEIQYGITARSVLDAALEALLTEETDA